MAFYRQLIRPLLFRCDPEWVHQASVRACQLAGATTPTRLLLRRFRSPSDSRLRCHVAGLNFANPVGLAAGWDKNGIALPGLRQLGFGAIEIGSISARPSRGNPGKRLHRLTADQAILVHYGVPNAGADAVAEQLATADRTTRRKNSRRKNRPLANDSEGDTECDADSDADVRLGVNLVATNDAQTCQANFAAIVADYCHSFSQLAPHADYVTLNLSCPNAAGHGVRFSSATEISQLLEMMSTHIDQHPACDRPVFLKLLPNWEPDVLDSLIAACESFSFVRGFMFNLPAGQPANLRTPLPQRQGLAGAVSGPPVRAHMLKCIRSLYSRLPANRFVIIGGGGIMSAEDAYETIRQGASLIQIYTALVYSGPQVIHEINRGLLKLLNRDGFEHIQAAVGVDV
ncbi:dihydroorotate dehydrogenase (quinone) [Planctomycetaceae bacterium SH139]